MHYWTGKKNLLIANDEHSLSYEQRVLEKNKNETFVATSVDRAIEVLNGDQDIDLVLIEDEILKQNEPEALLDKIFTVRPVPVITIWDTLSTNNDNDVKNICFTNYGCLLKKTNEFIFQQTLLMAHKLFKADQNKLKKRYTLSANQQLLTNTLESIHEGILVLDKKFRHTFWNKKMEELSGYTRDKVIGKTANEIFPFLAPEIIEAQKKAMTGEAVFNIETKFEIPDGPSGWTSESFIPLKDKNNQVTGVIGVVQDITNQKAFAEELENAKNRYKILVESSANSIIVHDGKKVLYTNPAAVKMLGAKKTDDLVGQSVDLFIHPVSKNTAKKRIHNVLDNDTTLDFVEERMRRLDGTSFYANVSGAPIKFNGKNAIQVVAQDITEHKLLEIELSKLSTSFSAVTGKELFDNVCQNLCDSLDIDYGFIGEFLPSSESINILSSYGKDEVFELDTYELEHSPCETVMRDNICIYTHGVQNKFPNDQHLKNIGIEAYMGMSVKSKTGEPLGIMVLMNKKPFTDEKHIHALFQLYSERVTAEMERLKTERLIKEKDTMLSSVSNNISEGIYRSTPEDGLIYVNEAFLKMFGYASKKEMMALESDALYANPQSRQSFVEKSKINAQGADHELEFKKKDGSTFWGLVSTSVVYDENGSPKYYDGAIHDITARKHYEEQLENSLKEKEVMLAEIHHRVKNNLAIISGLIDLQRFTLDDELVSTMLLNTRNRIMSIANVHELLYNSNNFAEIKISELIEQLCKGISKTYDTSANSVEFNINAEQIYMNANQAVPFGLLLNELINNSYKHAFSEIKKGIISIKLLDFDQKLRLFYKDNGTGFEGEFDKENLPQDTLGFSLIYNLSQQLHAEDVIVTNDNGFSFEMTFIKQVEPKKGSTLNKAFSADLKDFKHS